MVLQIEALLGSMKEVDRFSVAGSFRRALETSKDIDFIVVTEAVEEVREKLLNSLAIQEVVAAGIQNFGDFRLR